MAAEVLTRGRSLAGLCDYVNEPEGVRREKLLKVLARVAVDDDFVLELAHRRAEALRDYDLTWREKTALVNGDICWIEERIGRLDEGLATWLRCRLQREPW